MKNHYIKTILSGRSMIEMLGVLAIVGILSAGGIAGYSMAMQKYKGNQLIERLQLIATRARTIYKNSDYTAISKQNLIDSGKLSAQDFQNPFGGDIGIYIISGASFYIAATNLPAEVCVDILTTDWGDKGVFNGFDFNLDGGTLYQYGWGWGVDGGLPVSQASAINICKTSGNRRIALRLR